MSQGIQPCPFVATIIRRGRGLLHTWRSRVFVQCELRPLSAMLDYGYVARCLPLFSCVLRWSARRIVNASWKATSVGLRGLAVLMIIIVLVGCGENDAEPTGETTADPRQVLAAASQRLAETEALHFQLEVEGQTFVDPAGEIQLLSAEGDLARPNKVRVQFQVGLFGAGNVSIRMVTIGDESWTTDLLSGNWGPAPEEFGYDPTILFDNQGGLGPVMNRLVDPRLQGQEEIAGRQSYHIEASADQASVGPLTGDTMHGSPVTVSVWIDAATSDLLRVKLAEPANSGKPQPATWVLTLSDHGEKVEITPPI